MICDVLVALVDHDQLNAILPTVHQHALGHVARVLDTGRDALTNQLRRAGVPVEQAPATVVDAPLLLMISAAARCPAAAHLLIQSGVQSVWIVRRNGVWTEVGDSVALIAPEVTHHRSGHAHVPVPGIRDEAVGRYRNVPHLADPSPAAMDAEDILPR